MRHNYNRAVGWAEEPIFRLLLLRLVPCLAILACVQISLAEEMTMDEEGSEPTVPALDESFTLDQGQSRRIAEYVVTVAHIDEAHAASFEVTRSAAEPPEDGAPTFRFSVMGSGVGRWESLVVVVEGLEMGATPRARLRVYSREDEEVAVELATEVALHPHQVARLPDGSQLRLYSQSVFDARFRRVSEDPEETESRHPLSFQEGEYQRIGPYVVQLRSVNPTQRHLTLLVHPAHPRSMVPITYGEPFELPADRTALGPDGILVTMSSGHVVADELTARVEVRRRETNETVKLTFLPADQSISHQWYQRIRMGYTYVLRPGNFRGGENDVLPLLSLTIERPLAGTLELGKPVTIRENVPIEAPGGLVISWTNTGHVHFADGTGAVTYVLELWHEGETKTVEFEEEGGASWKGYSLEMRGTGQGIELTVRSNG